MYIVEFVLVDRKGNNISITCNDVDVYPTIISCTFDTHSMSYPKEIIKSYKPC